MPNIRSQRSQQFCCRFASEKVCAICTSVQASQVLRAIATLNSFNIATRAQKKGWRVKLPEAA